MKIAIEFDVKFHVLDKPFKTTIVAENEKDAEKRLCDFILSKIKMVSVEKKKSEWNDFANESEDILRILSD